jgi:hypothetical protein
MLRSIGWQPVTDILGQGIVSIFVSNQISTNVVQHPSSVKTLTTVQ